MCKSIYQWCCHTRKSTILILVYKTCALLLNDKNTKSMPIKMHLITLFRVMID